MSSKTFALITLTLIFSTFSAHAELAAGEPAFCELQTFLKTEINSTTPGLQRNRAFKVGQLIIAGMAVGNSKVAATKALAEKFSQYAPEEKSCTWYFNDGNSEAIKTFHHFYVSKPSYKTAKQAADEFESKLSPIFATNPVSFLSCAINHGYIGMGCDGQKHRGPSAYAMLLSYAGCSPKNATAIVNKIWGTNGVPVATREAIAERGYLLGDKHPEMREALQATMSTPEIF